MSSKKPYKVIVLGLPKTGTSTLAVMLRLLGYKVTGPDGQYQINDDQYLRMRFNTCDGFQDFPWCFEWRRFFEDQRVKYIILKRDPESWWKSFLDSYGREKTRYLSYPFMKISKEKENRDLFISYFNTYYQEVETQAREYPNRFLTIDIKTFEWKELCNFLDEDLPRDILGRLVKKPHVNREKAKVSKTVRYKMKNKLKKVMVQILGSERWDACILFLRKNGWV